MDPLLSSSPDPLNGTPTFSSPAKPRVTRSRKSLPMQGSSPTKQTFQLDVGDQLSPQKIRVTVEAEPPAEKTGRRAMGKKDVTRRKSSHTSPVRQSVRTTTTIIPLKGLSDTEDDNVNADEQPPKRGRGRPRKSTGTPIPSKAQARTATPSGKQGGRRRRTLGALVDGDDSEDWDFTIGDGVEIGRGKERSRSRSTKRATQNKTTPEAGQLSSPDKAVSSSTSRTGRGRRKTLSPEEILIHQDDSPKTAGEEETNSGDIPGGVFAPRDLNTLPTQSAFSTIRTSTTVGNDDPDILLAKFTPARHTPAKTGWSSPSVIPATRRDLLPSRLSSVVPSSPAPPFLENGSFDGVNGREVENAQMDETPSSGGEGKVMGGDFQESDTILESEEFSMISVDSVPCLREHISSPSGPSQNDDINKPTALNKSAERLRSMHHAAPEDSFSSIAPEILQAATPRRKVSKQNLLAVRPAYNSGEGDSFSSIPPEVLQAATPAKPLLHSHVLALKSIASNTVDDSFSSIPSAILQAATPARHQNVTTGHLKKLQIPKAVPKGTRKSTSVLFEPSAALGRPVPDISGLATPDETPSPTDDADCRVDHQANQHLSKPTSKAAESTESSIVYPPLRSSPPSVAPRRFTYTAHLRQQRLLHPGITQTPSIVFSSPSLPPLIQNLPANRKSGSSADDSRESSKEKLSPIVRAGRVLQDMTTSPSSQVRSQSLGSPFKSPGAHRNLPETAKDMPRAVEASEQSENSATGGRNLGDKLFGGFTDDTRRELRRSMMIGEEHAKTQVASTRTTKILNVARSEDPFSNGNDQLRQSAPEPKQSYTLGLPGQISIAYPSLADALVNKDTIRSEGAMSWQAENPIQIDVSSTNARNYANISSRQSSQPQKASPKEGMARETTESFERRREAEWAHERARVSSAIKSASASQVIVISSDAASPGTDDRVDEEEEEDIWQAEARDSSALSEEPAWKKVAEKQPGEKPRRSKIPSPWRQNSKRLTYSDELVRSSSPSQSDKSATVPIQAAVKAEPKPVKKSIRKRAAAQVLSDEDLPDSSVVWHIPQKSNFAPMPRKTRDLNVSELLASPLAVLPQLSPRKPPAARLPLHRKAEEQSSQDTTFLTPSRQKGESRAEDREADTAASDDDSEAESESDPDVFHTPPSVRSSRKSCIRTPTSTTPTKSVAFTSPTLSPPRLSSPKWTRDHWLLLQKTYYDAQRWPESPFQDPSRQVPGVPVSWDAKGWVSRDEIERVTGQKPSRSVGKTIRRQTKDGEETHIMVQTKWHLDIVKAFMTEVPGWEELHVARRLFALFIGEEARRNGTYHLFPRKGEKKEKGNGKGKGKGKGKVRGRGRKEKKRHVEKQCDAPATREMGK